MAVVSLHCVALMQATCTSLSLLSPSPSLSLSSPSLSLSLQTQMNASIRVYVAMFVSTPMEATTVTAGKGTPLIPMEFSAEVGHNLSEK